MTTCTCKIKDEPRERRGKRELRCTYRENKKAEGKFPRKCKVLGKRACEKTRRLSPQYPARNGKRSLPAVARNILQKLFEGLTWPSNFFKPFYIGQHFIFKMKMVFELSFWNLIVDMDIDIILDFW